MYIIHMHTHIYTYIHIHIPKYHHVSRRHKCQKEVVKIRE